MVCLPLPEYCSLSSVISVSYTHLIQDTEEYVEESLSLDEVEKEMIRKALEKHHGKRKSAAKDLNISERGLTWRVSSRRLVTREVSSR